MVIIDWEVPQVGDRFTVSDMAGATPVVRAAALDASSWTSNTEGPGAHTYRVTRTPGDGTSSSWSEMTVVVPTRELLVSEWALASAGASVKGITFDTARSPGHASMSPDRQHLAVAFAGTSNVELWQTDIAGNRQRQLTHGAFDTDPDFSPDGRMLAFTRRTSIGNGPPSVYLLDLNALAGNPSVEPVVVQGGTDAAMPSWTPAGDAFVVEEHATTDGGNGTQVDAGPTGLAVLTRTGQRTVVVGTSGGEYPSVSRTGRLAFGRFDLATGQGHILVTDLTGATPQRWSPTPLAGTSSVILEPAWDPQGNTIAATWTSPGAGPGGSYPVTIAAAGAPPQTWHTAESTRDGTHPSWVDLVDVAPSAVLTAPATSLSSTVTASITVTDVDDAIGGLSITCQVDTRPAQPCAPGAWTLSGLGDGPHLLVVRVTDPAGRAGEVRRTVVVDAATGITQALNQRFVTRVYSDLFNRAPDPGGLAGWTGALNRGTPRVAVANAITYSAEYRSKLITGSYVHYLGRNPDAAGLASWLGAMGRGMTIEQMESGFIASREYYTKSGSTDARWVTKLYADVLGRPVSSGEVAGWTAQLRRGVRRDRVAIGFLLSTERLSTVVDGYYVRLLGRHTDPSGQRTWVGILQRGGRDEAIIGGIIASAEYYGRV